MNTLQRAVCSPHPIHPIIGKILSVLKTLSHKLEKEIEMLQKDKEVLQSQLDSLMEDARGPRNAGVN
jgi:hypothetical protein